MDSSTGIPISCLRDGNAACGLLCFLPPENEEAWIRMEETVLKTINAFLNHQGGRMFFGITDAGRVKGLKANRLMRDKIRRGIDSVINAMRPQVLEVVGTRDGTGAGVGSCGAMCPRVFGSGALREDPGALLCGVTV